MRSITDKAQELIAEHHGSRLDAGVHAAMEADAALANNEHELKKFWIEVWREIRATVH